MLILLWTSIKDKVDSLSFIMRCTYLSYSYSIPTTLLWHTWSPNLSFLPISSFLHTVAFKADGGYYSLYFKSECNHFHKLFKLEFQSVLQKLFWSEIWREKKNTSNLLDGPVKINGYGSNRLMKYFYCQKQYILLYFQPFNLQLRLCTG